MSGKKSKGTSTQVAANSPATAASRPSWLMHPVTGIIIGSLLTVGLQYATRDWRAAQLQSKIGERELYKLNSLILESVAPNVTFQMKGASWGRHRVVIDFSVTNAGERSVYVRPGAHVDIFPKVAQKTLVASDWEVVVCDGGYISPKETISCPITLKTNLSFDTVGWLSYKYNLSSSAIQLDQDMLGRILGDEYPKGEIAKRLTKESHMKGEVGRP